MPTKRAYDRQRARAVRATARIERLRIQAAPESDAQEAAQGLLEGLIERAATDPIGALCEWARSCLVVPSGHERAGAPMVVPRYAADFLRESLDARESALLVARKNGKSAVCAVLALAHLVGPLRKAGWRGAVCSITREKAAELKRQAQEIAQASSLDGIDWYRSPAPGRAESAWGTLEILSADKSAGHASGFDLVLLDEAGLLRERDRALVDGLLSSVSARNGRLVSISIRGDSPFTAE